MTSNQKQLVSLLSNVLFGCPTDVVVNDEILQEARVQTVSSLVSRNEHSVFATNVQVDYAHAELTRIMDGIPFVTVKGYAAAYYYLNPLLRPMGDVDLYVETQYYLIASETLARSGFIKTDLEHERHDEYIKDGIVYELHSEFKGVPNGLEGIKTESENAEQKVRGYLSDVISTAVRVNTQFGEIIIPDAFHHGLIMLLHVAGHISNGGGIGLRHLCDWAVYVNRIDISEYKDRYIEMGLWTFACILTQVCEKYLGLRKMIWSGEYDEELIRCLFEDIVNSGNFGRRGTYRSMVNKFSKESVFELTKKRFPIAQKYPILLPGAVVFWGIRYLFRCLIGKRILLKPNDMIAGRDRIDLYKQFKLFESDV